MKLLLLSGLIFSQLIAQDIPTMDEGQMQDMMANMQKMQACLSKIDISSLQRIQTEAQHAENDINKFCKNGQRDKAQKIAISFSRRFMHEHAISQMKVCSKLSSMGSLLEIKQTDYTKTHVCDGESVDLAPSSPNRINW